MYDELLPDHHDSLMQRIERDLLDSYDEELEMEIDDARLGSGGDDLDGADTVSRQTYFRELLRLQGELVKLQDWVQHHRKKVVILFEGRDAAGKGGVIKRITQRLNPRVPRGRPARAQRPRAHAMVFPALCLPPACGRRDRSL